VVNRDRRDGAGVSPRTTVGDLLAKARAGLDRVTPAEASEAMRAGAVLVDVRSQDERERQGVVPGAVHYPLSVVLWRLDPAEPTTNPKLPLDTRVILLCRQGYSSSLAAAQLQAIGFENATDVIGGAEAWIAAGLPVEPDT
jgi:rhodanese-related sulfurtransferase